jgi:hypothetical protein
MGRAASDRLKIGSALERAAAQREGGFFSELLADLTCFGSASTDLRPKVRLPRLGAYWDSRDDPLTNVRALFRSRFIDANLGPTSWLQGINAEPRVEPAYVDDGVEGAALLIGASDWCHIGEPPPVPVKDREEGSLFPTWLHRWEGRYERVVPVLYESHQQKLDEGATIAHAHEKVRHAKAASRYTIVRRFGLQLVFICTAIAYAWRTLAVGNVTRNDLRRAVFAVLCTCMLCMLAAIQKSFDRIGEVLWVWCDAIDIYSEEASHYLQRELKRVVLSQILGYGLMVERLQEELYMHSHEWRQKDPLLVAGVNYVLPDGRRIWTATSRADQETVLFLDERERDVTDFYWLMNILPVQNERKTWQNPDCWMFSRTDVIDPDSEAVASRLQQNVPFREMNALLKRTEGEFWPSRNYLGYKSKGKIYMTAGALGFVMVVLGVVSVIAAGIIDPTAASTESLDISKFERQLPVFFGINLCLLLVGVACDSFPFIALFVDRSIVKIERKMNEHLWPHHDQPGSLQTIHDAWHNLIAEDNLRALHDSIMQYSRSGARATAMEADMMMTSAKTQVNDFMGAFATMAGV